MSYRGCHFLTRNSEFEESRKIYRAYRPSKMRTKTSAVPPERKKRTLFEIQWRCWTLWFIDQLSHIACSVSRKDSQLMLRCSPNPKKGYLKGTRYAVKGIINSVLLLQKAIGIWKGAKQSLAKFSSGHDSNPFPVLGFKRLQPPIHIFFEITKNRMPGQIFGE